MPDSTTHIFSMDGLVAIRKDMLRFAQLQIRNVEAAEDMVQEAIEAAIRGAAKFAGQSSLKTWVFAILRNLISDHIRLASRTVAASTLVEDGEDWQDRLDAMFNERGAWREGMKPVSWPTPDQAMQSQQFWLAFEACLTVLPEQTARVFMMREFLGFGSAEICTHLGLTTTNVHVILHRARLRLRACLQEGWGRPGDAT